MSAAPRAPRPGAPETRLSVLQDRERAALVADLRGDGVGELHRRITGR